MEVSGCGRMTIENAIYNYFDKFLPAYEENTVPDNAKFPFLTYECTSTTFNEGKVSINVSLWYRENTWANANNMAHRIEQDLGYGGTCIYTDTGEFIWITKDVPFIQSLGDNSDDKVKRKLLKLRLEYFTR